MALDDASFPNADSTKVLKALEEYAKLEKNAALRFIAFCNDEDTLKLITIKDTDHDCRQAAYRKITDQEFLKEVAKNDPSSNCRSHLLFYLRKDQEFLKERALAEEDDHLCYEIFSWIKDQEFLEKIVRDTNVRYRRRYCALCAAVKNANQDFLLEMAKNEAAFGNDRWVIFSHIEDLEFLKNVARSDIWPDCRKAAIKRIEELNSNSAVAKSPDEPKVVRSLWSRFLSFFFPRPVPALPPSLFSQAKRILNQRTVSNDLLLRLAPAVASHEADQAKLAEFENLQKGWGKELQETDQIITEMRKRISSAKKDVFTKEDLETMLAAYEKTLPAVEQMYELLSKQVSEVKKRVDENDSLFREAIDSEQLFIECSAADYQVVEQQKRLALLTQKTKEAATTTV